MIKIAVLGYGTVGSGVVEVIQTNQKVINARIGEELDIKYILDLSWLTADDQLSLEVNVSLLCTFIAFHGFYSHIL